MRTCRCAVLPLHRSFDPKKGVKLARKGATCLTRSVRGCREPYTRSCARPASFGYADNLDDSVRLLHQF